MGKWIETISTDAIIIHGNEISELLKGNGYLYKSKINRYV